MNFKKYFLIRKIGLKLIQFNIQEHLKGIKRQLFRKVPP